MKMMQSFLFAIVFTTVLAAEQIPSRPRFQRAVFE
jgi:hypothetical protein